MSFTMDITKILQYSTNTFSSMSLFVWLFLGAVFAGFVATVVIGVGKKIGGSS